MSLTRLVTVGAATADAAIAAASSDNDVDAAVLRAGVLVFLRAHAAEIAPEAATAEDAELLQAYQEWLETAVQYFGDGDAKQIREYTRRAALLSAELNLATRRAREPLPTSPLNETSNDGTIAASAAASTV